jgi:hypothetical protein
MKEEERKNFHRWLSRLFQYKRELPSVPSFIHLLVHPQSIHLSDQDFSLSSISLFRPSNNDSDIYRGERERFHSSLSFLLFTKIEIRGQQQRLHVDRIQYHISTNTHNISTVVCVCVSSLFFLNNCKITYLQNMQ